MTAESDARAAAAIAKRTAALLRDGRSVQRRTETLAATAMAINDRGQPLIAGARASVERLVMGLTYRQRGEQRRSRPPGRGLP